MKQQDILSASWHDVAVFLALSGLSAKTISDYVCALNRGLKLFGRNRLADIPVDLPGFLKAFPYHGFDPANFRSEKAYRAWRRKVIAAIKRFLGMIATKAPKPRIADGWSEFLDDAYQLVEQTEGWPRALLVPVCSLADHARARGWMPWDITSGRLAQLLDEAGPQDIRKIVANAAASLNRLGTGFPALAARLDPEPLELAAQPKRKPKPAAAEVPAPVMDEAISWIDAYCLGEMDEVMESYEDAKAAATRGTYLAAFRKYLSTAADLGLLAGANSLGAAFGREIFNLVVRAWIECQDPARQISDRTRRAYVNTLRMISRENGVETEHMDKALRLNQSLRKGRKAAEKMGKPAERFCAWLLGSREAEMLYRSLHVRFYEQCIALLGEPERVLSSREKAQVIQLGSLAAVAAIEVWGPPLRIENLIETRLYGDSPNLILPHGSVRHAHFHFRSDEVKNGKEIKQDLLPRRNRALEILQWYIREIRPLCPDADRSPYLFPGHAGPDQPITDDSLRNWLQKHGRALGIAMNPHWFRHAVASLYIRQHPGGYSHVARLLGDTEASVRKYYAWIDDEKVLAQVQLEILRMGGFCDGEE